MRKINTEIIGVFQPPSWKDFRHMLKHKKEDLSLVELGSHLRIKEGLRAQESGAKGNDESSADVT